MTTPITTQTTLKAEFLIPLSVLNALIDAEDFSDDCVGLHTAAWEATLHYLAKRHPGFTEADILDSSVFEHACHLWVLARLYEMRGLERDKEAAEDWWTEYRKEMAEVQIDDNVADATETMLVRQ